ncbi:sulfur carrier protein ThiS [Shewanella sp. YIC-542]|uniref:sulfur carrier protein ThiS n=1 Tax=Shewanella mytili TaxID=3377111 RepID=UPI00398F7766
MNITITLNGKPLQLADSTTLDVLVSQQGFTPTAVAIVRNGTLVPRSCWPQTCCQAGDNLEFFTAVAGG